MKAELLSNSASGKRLGPVIGVFAAGDPRIDKPSRQRCKNIVKMVAESLAGRIMLPDGVTARVVFTEILVDGEKQADFVAQQFKDAGVNVLVCTPDTWAFPQLSVISLLAQFPRTTPINFTCGNSGPKPGVVFSHAANGALAQTGWLSHLNVGSWPDNGLSPKMSPETRSALVDWAYAAVTTQYLRGRRIVTFGHDSMGMETALAHVIPTRNQFGMEITRLDMKLVADMLMMKSYDKDELRAFRAFIDDHVGDRLEVPTQEDSDRFDQSLALYLILRDLMDDLNAVGGGFMSQLEWGSDVRGLPLPVADVAESFFNSTFDHRGLKPVMPFATEADMQALLTMVFFSTLTGGNPPLFMDFRKVWEPDELDKFITAVHKDTKELIVNHYPKGLVDGNNSGSASLDWAANPRTPIDEIMSRVSMPLANKDYFPGLGNSVTFVSPGGLTGIAGRLAYSSLSGMFSLSWDEAETTEVSGKLAEALCNATDSTWPHTFVVPKYASMYEYKHYPPANHLHMVQGLTPARLEYWMDLNNVLSQAPWAARPRFIEGTDRPIPLLYLANGGDENAVRMKLAGK